MSKSLNRRTILAGAAAATVPTAALSAPPIVSATDPIFPLIEQHRACGALVAKAKQSRSTLEGMISPLSDYIDPAQPWNYRLAGERRSAANPEFERAVDAMSAAQSAEYEIELALIRAAPETPAGAAALLRHVVQFCGADEDDSELSQIESLMTIMSSAATVLEGVTEAW
jgi:hypothetical protein